MKQTNLDPSPPSDSGRRRFTRGGLAAPVLLGTLASKPILGQAGGLQCTMSGKMSGNLSFGGNSQCQSMGATSTQWVNNMSWPPPLTRETFFNGWGQVVATSNTTSAIFSQISVTTTSTTLAAVFFARNSNGNPTGAKATMLQVLKGEAASTSSATPALGIAVVTSLLNAYSTLNYPVSPRQIIDAFNAVYAGGSYMVGGLTPWNQAQVLDYLQSLYP